MPRSPKDFAGAADNAVSSAMYGETSLPGKLDPNVAYQSTLARKLDDIDVTYQSSLPRKLDNDVAY
jgi:hypothetical protein